MLFADVDHIPTAASLGVVDLVLLAAIGLPLLLTRQRPSYPPDASTVVPTLLSLNAPIFHRKLSPASKSLLREPAAWPGTFRAGLRAPDCQPRLAGAAQFPRDSCLSFSDFYHPFPGVDYAEVGTV